MARHKPSNREVGALAEVKVQPEHAPGIQQFSLRFRVKRIHRPPPRKIRPIGRTRIKHDDNSSVNDNQSNIVKADFRTYARALTVTVEATVLMARLVIMVTVVSSAKEKGLQLRE